jgi:hypothetical protein
MTAVEALIQSIDGRLQELGGEITRLEDARNALAKGNGAAANGTSRARPSRSSSGARKPIAESEIVRAAVAHGGPVSASELRDALGLGGEQSNALSVKLTRMVNAGRLRREGERRGTRYVVAS